MLTKIGVSNFKCFANLDLPCAPITLLCGMNGMGKSSVMQALLVLRQSYDLRELREGRIALGGELADIGAGRDALFEYADSDVIAFSLRRNDVEAPCELSCDYDRGSDRLNLRPTSDAPGGFGISDPWRRMPPFGGIFVYIDAERAGPRKTYPHSETAARRGELGVRGEYALNYLNARGDETWPEGDPRFEGCDSRRLTAGVERWLGEISPGARLRLRTVTDADALIAGFAFDGPGDVPTRPYRATNVGFGLSYVLPLLVAMFLPAGALCLIENPEAHLHPRGQTKLAELAVRATMAGVQIIVETHSDHFMDGVRIAVRDGLIPPEDAAFHYFERKDGATVVSSPKIDRNGRLSSWPAGFFDQHEENLARLLAPVR